MKYNYSVNSSVINGSSTEVVLKGSERWKKSVTLPTKDGGGNPITYTAYEKDVRSSEAVFSFADRRPDKAVGNHSVPLAYRQYRRTHKEFLAGIRFKSQSGQAGSGL